MKLSDHPTVKAYQEKNSRNPARPNTLAPAGLKNMALGAGADDVGIIDIDRNALGEYRRDLTVVMPEVRSIMVMAFRINQGALNSRAHSVADLEFKQVWMHANHVGRQLAGQFRRHGVNAINMPAGFPYEAGRWPGKMWLTNDKVFATEAGLGHMGWNRLVLHQKFGAAIALGCILLDRSCDVYDQPLGFNPCVECGLCLKVCPVGAVRQTEDFDFTACYSHNYRERLGGFQNWVEQLVDSRDHADYRKRVDDSETISMWQNLSIGAQTRCDRCMAVCPAGEETIGPYLDDRKAYIADTVKPFNRLEETVYVVKGSDAEQYVVSQFPEKSIRLISNGIRPTTAKMFLESLPLVFQKGQASDLAAVYHFTFTGSEQLKGTVSIQGGKLEVSDGHVGTPDLQLTADSVTWIKFLAKETGLIRSLMGRKIKIKGPPRLMTAFARCFPA